VVEAAAQVVKLVVMAVLAVEQDLILVLLEALELLVKALMEMELAMPMAAVVVEQDHHHQVGLLVIQKVAWVVKH
jgi:hypothetical protein